MPWKSTLRFAVAILLLVALWGAPAAFAADRLAEGDGVPATPRQGQSWVTVVLEFFAGWLPTAEAIASEEVCAPEDPDCPDGGGTANPDGGGGDLPGPDNGPGLDPLG